MKTFVVAVNLMILAAMALVYTNHVHAEEIKRYQMQIQIEQTVAEAIING